MPVFVEDPAQFSKLRLKSELIAHNITLPQPESKKQVYVGLYLKHIAQKSAADFSSDEEDNVQEQVPDVVGEEGPEKEEPDRMDPSGLTDDELKTMLLEHGVQAGPIVATTRLLYERKLQRLLNPASLNGTADADQYSDSEEEEEEESGSEQAGPDTVTLPDQNQHVESQEPAKDLLSELFPDTKPTPTGITATRRRPIKGAAGRPVQFKYPDTPLSPSTLERRALERRLVPVWVQIAVFVVVVCLVCLIYWFMEDGSDNLFTELLDSLSMEPGAGTEAEGGLSPPLPEPQGAPLLPPPAEQE